MWGPKIKTIVGKTDEWKNVKTNWWADERLRAQNAYMLKKWTKFLCAIVCFTASSFSSSSTWDYRVSIHSNVQSKMYNIRQVPYASHEDRCEWGQNNTNLGKNGRNDLFWLVPMFAKTILSGFHHSLVVYFFFGSKIDHIRPANKAEPRKIARFSFYLILIVAYVSFSLRFDHKEAERIEYPAIRENPKNRNKSWAKCAVASTTCNVIFCACFMLLTSAAEEGNLRDVQHTPLNQAQIDWSNWCARNSCVRNMFLGAKRTMCTVIRSKVNG